MLSKQFQESLVRGMKGSALSEREFWEDLEDRINLEAFARRLIELIRSHNSRSAFSLEHLMTTFAILVLNLSARGEVTAKQGFELNIFDLLSEKTESSPNMEWLLDLYRGVPEADGLGNLV